MRIAGVDIPDEKRVEASLTHIYGVGRFNVKNVLAAARVDPDTRVKNLTEDEVARLRKALERLNIEGDLRRVVLENIKRLKEIGSYRGLRHSQSLPVRGQRTRSNARTKRGKRRTIGAISKKVAQRMMKGGQARLPGGEVKGSLGKKTGS